MKDFLNVTIAVVICIGVYYFLTPLTNVGPKIQAFSSDWTRELSAPRQSIPYRAPNRIREWKCGEVKITSLDFWPSDWCWCADYGYKNERVTHRYDKYMMNAYKDKIDYWGLSDDVVSDNKLYRICPDNFLQQLDKLEVK